MASTNYSETKQNTSNELRDSDLSSALVAKIVRGLGNNVAINNNTNPAHVLTPSDIHDKDLVYSDHSGAVNLNAIKASDITKLDAIIFNSNDGVALTMNQGSGAAAFKAWIVTSGGDDTIKLSGAGVKVSSGEGNDSITTGNGNDSIDAGAGNDSISSGNGNDSITAGSGNDTINSGSGNDTINTGSGNDSVNAGVGNDSVVIGSGNDTVFAGNGDDIVKLARGFTGNANIDGGKNFDTADFRNVDIFDAAKSGSIVTVTLMDHSVIKVTSVEEFIYDSNGTDSGGKIITVGVNDFVNHDFIA